MNPASLKIKGRSLCRVQQRLIKPIERSRTRNLGESGWRPDLVKKRIRLVVVDVGARISKKG